MSVKTAAKTAPVKSAETVAEPTKVAETPAAVSWDELPPAEIATYQRTPSRVDREASTPTIVKLRVVAGFEASKVAGEAVWFTQPCGSKERAEEFVKLARLYSTFREWSFAGAVNPSATSEVRFSIRTKREYKKKAVAAVTPAETTVSA